MRVGGFELVEPLPRLKDPHAIAMLRPWIDVGAVGTLVLTRLELTYAAMEIATLVRPGNFFDFTRYRPILRIRNGRRETIIPNSLITCAKNEDGNDFVFLHLLEPHMFGEAYAKAVWDILKLLGIQRYVQIGSMYDVVPHTRPLMVTGSSSSPYLGQKLSAAGIHQSNYQGPTTICQLIPQEAQRAGLETMSLMLHLPQYTELDEDFMGMVAMLKVLHQIYNIPVSEADTLKAEKQQKSLDNALQSNRKLRAIVTQLESHYDTQLTSHEGKEAPQLSPEVEQFLKEMENRFKDS